MAFLLLLNASLLSQADITHYSKQLTLQHRVLGWALIRIRNLALVLHYASQEAEQWLCVEQSHELFSNIRGRGGASKRLLSLVNEPLPYKNCEFFEMCIRFGTVRVVHSKSSDKHESSLILKVALNKSWCIN